MAIQPTAKEKGRNVHCSRNIQMSGMNGSQIGLENWVIIYIYCTFQPSFPPNGIDCEQLNVDITLVEVQ